MTAIWKQTIIAESEATILIEGNHYFPADSAKQEFLVASDTRTTCPWKGVASYYHVEVSGDRNRDAAWYYPRTKPAADMIEGYIAFWRGVEIVQ